MPGLSAGKVARSNAGIGAGAVASLTLVALALLLALALAMPTAAAEDTEEEDVGELLITIIISIALTVGLVAIVIWWVQRGLRKRAAAFGEFATTNGLGITGAEERHPIVEGSYRRRHFRLDTYTTGGSKSSTTHTRMQLSLEPLYDGHLELRHEGLLAKLGKRFGTEDVQLHDIEFDPRYIIQCSDPTLPEVVLSQAVREKLLGLKKYHFSWDDDKAEAERVGEEFDAERLKALLEILTEVADALERYGGRAA